jgi:probable HAF family extracellular repeat protein
MTRLGTLGGGNNVLDGATGINASGQVVGQSALPTLENHAFITGPNGMGMTDLGTFGDGATSEALAVNNAGRVVGTSTVGVAGDRPYAFITGPDGVGMTFLGTLGGDSIPYGINETGQVVGTSDTRSGEQHAFITGPNGVGMTDLSALGGWSSFGAGINDAGRVVGGYSVADGGPLNHAFITGPDGVGMTDLTSLISPPSGFSWETALGINNHDQVIVIATSIPEPETYAMLFAGLALIGFMARRRTLRENFPSPAFGPDQYPCQLLYP